ncbi:MAG: hypothetical protein AAGD14_15000 [Planctomycetota bacterium]
MTHYERVKRKRLGDLIVDEGLVEKDVVIAALRDQQASGRLLSSILLEYEALDPFDLARIVTEQYQVPFVDLENYTVHKDLIQEFPAELLYRHRMLPLERFGKLVAMACQEVPSLDAYRELRELDNVDSVFVYSAFSRDVLLKLQENHPYEEPSYEPDPSAEPANMGGDDTWQSLFDTANESVISDLDE